MKKALAVVMVVALLGLGTSAFAHGWGGGYGTHMRGGGYGPMWGYNGDEKTLDETADLRAEIHGKRFEYAEALRTGDTEKARTLAKELDGLYGKLEAKAPAGREYFRGYGCTGPYGW